MGGKIRIAIVGVGNCASALVQGVSYYGDAKSNSQIPGLTHTVLGGYHINDIAFSAAFDVAANKVGKMLGEAVEAEPNNTIRFAPHLNNGCVIQRGPTLDGLGKYVSDVVEESKASAVDVADILRRSETDIVVSYLPVGSQRATEYYAEQAIAAGCGFINCIPVFIASDPEWRARFERAKLPLIGDDVKSQVGATIVHRVLANLMRERGLRIDRTYQLNVGGNTDFMNMLERERLESKKLSKTRAVTSQIDPDMPPENIHVGPSDYVPWLTDRKICYIRLEATAFGGVPLACELKLDVWDSPNSAGIVVDAIRCAKLAQDRKIGGALVGPSAYLMKSPPQQFDDHEAQRRLEEFIAGASNE